MPWGKSKFPEKHTRQNTISEKEEGLNLPPLPTPLPPSCPFVFGGWGECSRVLSLFYHASHSNIDQIEWMPLYCLDNLSRFHICFGKMFGYSETFWGKKNDWLANLLKSHISSQNNLTKKTKMKRSLRLSGSKWLLAWNK